MIESFDEACCLDPNRVRDPEVIDRLLCLLNQYPPPYSPQNTKAPPGALLFLQFRLL